MRMQKLWLAKNSFAQLSLTGSLAQHNNKKKSENLFNYHFMRFIWVNSLTHSARVSVCVCVLPCLNAFEKVSFSFWVFWKSIMKAEEGFVRILFQQNKKEAEIIFICKSKM